MPVTVTPISPAVGAEIGNVDLRRLGDPDFALRAWERQQLNHGRGLAEHAIALGRRSVRQRDGSQPPTPSVRDVAERFAGIAQPLPRE